MQNKGYYAVRSFRVIDFDSNRKQIGQCDFLLVITTNLHSFSYHFKVIADYCSGFGRKNS